MRTSPWPRLAAPLLVLGVVVVGQSGGQDLVEDPPEFAATSARPLASYPSVPVRHRLAAPLEGRTDPALVARPDGHALLACLGTRLGEGDRVLAFDLSRDGMTPLPPVPGEPGEIAGLAAVLDAEGRPQLVWGRLVDGVCRLFTAVLEDETWSEPVSLETGPGPCLHPRTHRTAGGEVVLVWQEFVATEPRGRFEVFLGRLEGTRLTGRIQLSDRPFSNVQPVVSSAPDGTLWVAFMEYTGRDFEVVLRSIAADGTVSPAHAVSADPVADDLHPSIAVTDDAGVWVAFDSIRDHERGRSAPWQPGDAQQENRNAVRVVCFRDGAFHTVATDPPDPEGLVATDTMFHESGGLPRLVLGHRGELHLFLRFLYRDPEGGRAYAYPVLAQALGTEGFGGPRLLADSAGAPDPVAVCATPSGLWAAYQHDARLETPTGRRHRVPAELARDLESRDICLTRFQGAPAIAATLIETEGPAPRQPSLLVREDRPAERREHPLVDPDTDPVITGQEHLVVKTEKRTYRVYWGDLHRHSSVSRCSVGREPRPEDRYLFGRDVMLYDFFALTDHAGQIDPFDWWRMTKMVDLYRTPVFTPFQGFEWTGQKDGHSNVILRHRNGQIASFAHQRGSTIRRLWDFLPRGDALTIPHHTAATNNGTRWVDQDPRYLRQVEVYQALRGSCEFGGCYRQSRSAQQDQQFVQPGLDTGLEFGLIASTDHGSGASYAAVLAEGPDRDSLFEALYRRRTYASTTKGILLDFRVDGRLMGRSIKVTEPPVVELRVRGTRQLAEVVVFRNGEVWRSAGREDRDPERRDSLTLRLDLSTPEAAREQDWKLTMGVSEGRFLSARRRPLREGPGPFQRPGWSLLEKDRVEYTRPGGTSTDGAAMDRRVRVKASDLDTLTVQAGASTHTVTVGDLRRGPLRGEDAGRSWTLRVYGAADAMVDPSRGMGSQEFQATWTEAELPEGKSWYYARIIQTDGEVAWSSPVFVQRKR